MKNERLKTDVVKREDLRAGDVLLCPPIDFPEGWIGHIIVLLTKGKVSHAALFYGERNGELQVAHSDLNGIIYESLDDFIGVEPVFYVGRHKRQTDLKAVLDAASKYAVDKAQKDIIKKEEDDKPIPYPVSDFAILGILLLANLFLKDTFWNRAFYKLALLVSVKLMKRVNKKRYTEQSMTCSQYATQCFTEAGPIYDIKFKKLLLQFGELKPKDGKISLLDLLNPDETLDSLEMKINEEAILEREHEIAEQFIELMQNEKQTSPEEYVDKKDLIKVAKKLLVSLCIILTNKNVTSVKEALAILSSNRNYLVLPDDLLSNTENLDVFDPFGIDKA